MLDVWMKYKLKGISIVFWGVNTVPSIDYIRLWVQHMQACTHMLMQLHLLGRDIDLPSSSILFYIYSNFFGYLNWNYDGLGLKNVGEWVDLLFLVVHAQQLQQEFKTTFPPNFLANSYQTRTQI